MPIQTIPSYYKVKLHTLYGWAFLLSCIYVYDCHIDVNKDLYSFSKLYIGFDDIARHDTI